MSRTWRAEKFSALIDEIAASGYGLTLGLHTRIERRIAELARKAIAGNIYVNRNMIGAVVGSQPFGGFGLSGTGPKAGGPDYLRRFYSETTLTVEPRLARRRRRAVGDGRLIPSAPLRPVIPAMSLKME